MEKNGEKIDLQFVQAVVPKTGYTFWTSFFTTPYKIKITRKRDFEYSLLNFQHFVTSNTSFRIYWGKEK